MKRILGLAAILLIAASAFAADDGNNKWRFNSVNVINPSTTYDLISTTNGAGNVKGVHCDGPNAIALTMYVDGGTGQTIVWDPGSNDDGFVPYNIRFGTSIRITASRSSGLYSSDHLCEVSWGLD